MISPENHHNLSSNQPIPTLLALYAHRRRHPNRIKKPSLSMRWTITVSQPRREHHPHPPISTEHRSRCATETRNMVALNRRPLAWDLQHPAPAMLMMNRRPLEWDLQHPASVMPTMNRRSLTWNLQHPAQNTSTMNRRPLAWDLWRTRHWI